MNFQLEGLNLNIHRRENLTSRNKNIRSLQS
jgi:hypothetical protein